MFFVRFTTMTAYKWHNWFFLTLADSRQTTENITGQGNIEILFLAFVRRKRSSKFTSLILEILCNLMGFIRVRKFSVDFVSIKLTIKLRGALITLGGGGVKCIFADSSAEKIVGNLYFFV